MEANTELKVKERTISIVVFGPDGKVKQDLGVVSYYHRNPLRRLAWRIKQLFRRK